MADIFFSPLSSVITTDQIPESLNFIETGLDTVLDKVFFKDLKVQRSSNFSSAAYDLDIVIQSGVLKLEIPGTGLVLLLNPDLENPNADYSVIPVSLTWDWRILQYFRDYKVNSFSFSPKAIADLILDVAQVSDQSLLVTAAYNFISTSDPLDKFVVDANNKYSNLNIPYPLDADQNVTVTNILTAIDQYPDLSLYDLLLENYIIDPSNLSKSLQKVDQLFSSIVGYNIIEDVKALFILSYFKNATHVGLTATPKETKETSNTEYFGEPVYTYSLKQGIDDGFLAPYRVIRIGLDVDTEGWRPQQGKTDKDGFEVEDRIYNRKDFDRSLVIEERTELVAQKLTEFLKGYDRFAKTIVFCMDIDHAERMRTALSKQNADLVAANYKYIMQITGDNDEGKRELDNFINPEEKYPVIATTSELMTTGVDAQTCKVIVLDTNISSMTKFKQIIGRGTRINEEYGKLYFTILDFRNATDLFADKDFDGDPIRVKPVSQDTDLGNIIDEEEQDLTPIIDEISGDEIEIERPEIRNLVAEPAAEYKKREKIYVNGVDVSILISREMYFDQHGKPITVSLKDHTKEIIKQKYASLNDFLTQWNSTDRKEAIIAELQDQGVMVEALYEAVNKEVDLFDLICHVAFDQPPLTRKERANSVKKRNYFTKYGDQAKQVLEALLDKYADEGIANIESMEVLRVNPFDGFGSAYEIVNGIFGGKIKYQEAVRELEQELYQRA